MTIANMVSRWENLNVPEAVISAMREKAGELPDFNREQLEMGLRSDGGEVAPPYSFVTVQLKSVKAGLAGVSDRVTLYDTGDHYRQMYAEVRGEDVIFGSRDWKSSDLEAKYGLEIYGLTPASKRNFNEEFLILEFIRQVKNNLYGRM